MCACSAQHHDAGEMMSRLAKLRQALVACVEANEHAPELEKVRIESCLCVCVCVCVSAVVRLCGVCLTLCVHGPTHMDTRVCLCVCVSMCVCVCTLSLAYFQRTGFAHAPLVCKSPLSASCVCVCRVCVCVCVSQVDKSDFLIDRQLMAQLQAEADRHVASVKETAKKQVFTHIHTHTHLHPLA